MDYELVLKNSSSASFTSDRQIQIIFTQRNQYRAQIFVYA